MRFASLNLYLWDQTRPAFTALWNHLRPIFAGNKIKTGAEIHPPNQTSPRILANNHTLAIAQVCGIDVSTHGQKLYRTLGALSDNTNPEPGHYHSTLIASVSKPQVGVDNLREHVAAVNNHGSFSGDIALRAFIFGKSRGAHLKNALVTGGHLHSVRAVAAGHADFAAIDSLCFNFARRFHPDLLASVRVIGHTPTMPAPPLVIARDLPPSLRAELIGAVGEFFDTPEGAAAMRDIGVRGFVAMPDSAYEVHKFV